jgi:hypothetical protein
MAWIATKYLITAGLVVLISELAKRSDKLGAFIASIPLVTLLTLIWLYVEGAPTQKISNHAYYTFWYVLPTLPMFLVFPWLLAKSGFWFALVGSALITAICFVLVARIALAFGVDLV